MIRPVITSTTIEIVFVTMSGERATGEDSRTRHRERAEAINQALVHVFVEPDRGHEAAEGDVLDDDPGDQEVRVVVAGDVDRAAEHVAEQQHEHDRLDRECEQQLGRARQADQVPLGDHRGVGDGPSQAASLPGPGRRR